jgi:hypothetical protein
MDEDSPRDRDRDQDSYCMSTRLASESTGSTGRPSWAGYLTLGLEDGETSLSLERRKAVDLASTRVSIERSELSRNRQDGGTFTAYVVSVTSGNQHWNMRRRYTDFSYLHHQLSKQCSDNSLPTIPPKRFFGSSKDHAFVEDRRTKLEAYLNALFVAPSAWNTPLLVTFLDGPNNTLMYLWNLERMRKMQKMITTMDIQNRDEAEELNTELRHARGQVQELQERVRRMEMLFLQGAAGVASAADHDVDALRSLSLGNLGDASLRSGDSSDLESADDTRNAGYRGSSGYREDMVPLPDAPLQPEEVVEVLSWTQSIADMVQHEELQALIPGVVPGGGGGPRTRNSRAVSMDMIRRTLSVDSLARGGTGGGGAERQRDQTFAMSMHLQDTLQLSNKVLRDSFQLSPDRVDSRASGASAGSSIPGSAGGGVDLGTGLNIDVETISIENIDIDANAKAKATSPCDSSEACIVSELMGCSGADTPDAAAGAGATGTGAGGWEQRLCGRFDEVVRALQPSQDAIDSREGIYQYLRGVVQHVLGVQIFPVGSFVGRVFLLEGDLDMTFILPKSVESDSWFVKLNEVLCMAAMGLTGPMNGSDKQPFLRMQVNNISFINAEVKIIKATINNISVDISANQIGSVYAQAFVEQCDQCVGRSHLLKRTILMAKAWCANESQRFSTAEGAEGAGEGGSIFGSSKGRLSSYSIIVMVVWIFNAYGHQIRSPLQALLCFLRYFSGFDWYRHALTVTGAVCIGDLSPLPEEAAALQPTERFFPEAVLNTYKLRHEALWNKKLPADPKAAAGAAADAAPATATATAAASDSKRQADGTPAPAVEEVYMRGILNIIDPIKARKNITRSVDGPGFQAIRTGFSKGYAAFLHMAEQCRAVPVPVSVPVSVPVIGSTPAASDSTPDSGSGRVRGSSSGSGNSNSAGAAAGNADVPFVRGFLSSTTATLKDAGRGRLAAQPADPLHTSAEELELWIKHVELVFSPLSREALGSLIYHILKLTGPVPVGEIGKALQDMTSISTITEVIKTEFKGLKKLIELCPEYFSVGTEHPFNPIVAVRPDAEPYFKDLSFIVSSLVVSSIPLLYAMIYIPPHGFLTTTY